uniref:Uncharacterized protein n=1 Tax=Ascaris lumbricoides TaxID=6252 RepID=A0A0M3ILX3_ASCLU
METVTEMVVIKFTAIDWCVDSPFLPNMPNRDFSLMQFIIDKMALNLKTDSFRSRARIDSTRTSCCAKML